MERPEEHYYKLNRFLLSVSGLCPYQSRWNAYLLRAALTLIMLSSVFVQVAHIFTTDVVTVDLIVDTMPELLLIIGTMTNLYMRIIHVGRFGELFERISKDWALQKTHHENKIMHEYAETSRLFTLYYLILMYANVMGYNIWMFTPEMLDIISPMNESRPRRRPFNAEFFIDEERYFYLIRFQISLVLVALPIIYITCSTLFLILTQHVCGMCELLGYRAERLFSIVKDKTACDLIQRSQINYRNLTVFVRLHFDIIQFVELIETCHTIPFIVDITAVMILMGCSLIQILNISDVELAIRSISVTICALCYVFICCFMGQRVTDLSSGICEKIYNSKWYNTVVSEQKALLVIMMKRYHPLMLTACKIYVMSLQNFGMILQTAVSYCMCIRQF